MIKIYYRNDSSCKLEIIKNNPKMSMNIFCVKSEIHESGSHKRPGVNFIKPKCQNFYLKMALSKCKNNYGVFFVQFHKSLNAKIFPTQRQKMMAFCVKFCNTNLALKSRNG